MTAKAAFVAHSPIQVGDTVVVSRPRKVFDTVMRLEAVHRIRDIYTIHSAATGDVWFNYVLEQGEVVGQSAISHRIVDGAMVEVGPERHASTGPAR